MLYIVLLFDGILTCFTIIIAWFPGLLAVQRSLCKVFRAGQRLRLRVGEFLRQQRLGFHHQLPCSALWRQCPSAWHNLLLQSSPQRVLRTKDSRIRPRYWQEAVPELLAGHRHHIASHHHHSSCVRVFWNSLPCFPFNFLFFVNFLHL